MQRELSSPFDLERFGSGRHQAQQEAEQPGDRGAVGNQETNNCSIIAIMSAEDQVSCICKKQVLSMDSLTDSHHLQHVSLATTSAGIRIKMMHQKARGIYQERSESCKMVRFGPQWLTCMVEKTRAAAFTGTMLPTKSLTSRGVVTTAAMVLTLVIRTAEVP